MELYSILDDIVMFVERTLAHVIENVAGTFPVVLVTGPRQVGKTTLLEHCALPGMHYVSLDDPSARQLAHEDPALFLQRFAPPVLIDEIQYAPGLFQAIKILVDRERIPGQVWLTGSQPFHLMQGISETLAGRVGILNLLGLSAAELDGRAADSQPFLPTPEHLQRLEKRSTPRSVMDIFHRIWTGSFPVVALNLEVNRDVFYSSYLQTYLQRDVRDLARVGDETAFVRFIRGAAARTGQLLNIAELARDADVDPKTAKSWLSILETSGLVRLLEPFHTNRTKRLIKAPKLYFLDTGLCCHLTRWTSPEALEAGAMAGAMLESYLFSEIVKSYLHNGQSGVFYFYRDRDQKEVDLLIEQDGVLYPLEFKKSARPGQSAVKHFGVLNKLDLPIGPGGVLCMSEKIVPITRQASAIPVWMV